MSLLSLKTLSLQIGGTPVLQGIDLDMAQGQITAITGESG